MKKAFTLIELMISITIVVILTMVAIAPYNYYQNKTKLKVATREISQALYEGRNMAMNGIVGESGNSSIGIYFDSDELSKDKIKLFSYPHDIEEIDIKNFEEGNIKIKKTLLLQKGIEIDDISGKENMLFLFDAITGELNCYTWTESVKNKVEEDILEINISYKGTTSENLKKQLKYFTSTNIIDY